MTLCRDVCKTAEPIKMLFGLWTPVVPTKHVCQMGIHIPICKGATFRGRHARRYSYMSRTKRLHWLRYCLGCWLRWA